MTAAGGEVSTIKPNHAIMRAAISAAEASGTPFGAALAMGDELFVTAANQTQKLHDPTAHAEVMAIRRLGERIQASDMSGFTLYTTCEPCPMCMSAAIWAHIPVVIFGCPISVIANYMKQIRLDSAEIKKHAFADVTLYRGFLQDECEDLLKRFA
ncbi:MAG: nucleoside deaminase [Balneolaceae bacterium]